MKKYVMALDAGTTSNRAILFAADGRIAAVAQKEFRQIYPKPGWVEHDAEEILSTQLEVAREVLKTAGATARSSRRSDGWTGCSVRPGARSSARRR